MCCTSGVDLARSGAICSTVLTPSTRANTFLCMCCSVRVWTGVNVGTHRDGFPDEGGLICRGGGLSCMGRGVVVWRLHSKSPYCCMMVYASFCWRRYCPVGVVIAQE